MRFETHAFTLRQLQYAVGVAETRSFGRAAELCHVSQPSLSAQVAQLESVLGVQIFERTRRGVRLTLAGSEVIERARRILREADDLSEAGGRLADPFTGTLRLGVIPTISPYLLPQLTPALRERYPRLEIRWVEDKTAALVAGLTAASLDAALLALEADVGNVEAAVLGRDPFVLAAPHGHPLSRQRGPVPLRELDGQSVLLLDDGHCFRDQALDLCAHAHARELAFRATSLSTLTQMVAGGAGVTLLPQLAVPTEARRGDVVVRRFVPPAPGRTLALVWRRHAALDSALRHLAATLREVYTRLESSPAREAQRPRAASGRALRRGRAGGYGPGR
jgi:LysR family transcriptional regulator, hydrogen peroxide-inducible genes activator